MKIGKKFKLFCLLASMCAVIFGCSFSETNQQETNNKEDKEFSWQWVIEPAKYENIYFANMGLIIAINEEGKYGVFNEMGEMVIPFEYDYISKYNYGIASVKKDGKAFYIDEDGTHIWGSVYEGNLSFKEELGAVKINGLWGYIDLNGKEVIACEYEDARAFSEGIAAVKANGKWGFINKNGELIVECQYEEVKDFQGYNAAVKANGKWGFINVDGEVISECIYDSVKDFKENYAAVMQKEKWGFIDNNGKIKIELQYDDVGNFSEGKAAVKVCKYNNEVDQWAYIDKQNQVVVDYSTYYGVEGLMDYVGEFHNGLAFVSKEFYSIIDTKGRKVFDGSSSQFFISSLFYDEEYDIIPVYVYIDDEMKVKKYGLIGLNGEQRLEPVFDFIGEINGAYLIVYQKSDCENEYDKMGVIKLEKNNRG